MPSSLIAPHGGRLVAPLAPEPERAAKLTRAAGLPAVRLTSREVSDLIMIGMGAFSPLTGFMGEADYLGVVTDMRMADGTLWPIPITLAPAAGVDGITPGQEIALVDDQPGVTRDRREGEAKLGDLRFRLFDTAGLDDVKGDSLEARMSAQAETAVDDADVVLFVIDSRVGVTPTDREFAERVRRRGKPVILVANKAEGRGQNHGVLEAYELGFGEPLPISAEHGEGLDYLYEAILPYTEEHKDVEGDERGDGPLRLAIIGQPNAGKSTLLNALSGAGVLVEDKLFATLDPTTRRVLLPSGREALFSDTVGFIQKLPTQLVAAFRATLEEINEADLLLHIVDITHPQVSEQSEAVMDTLADLEVIDRPMLYALNKIDRLEDREVLDDWLEEYPGSVAISATRGQGLEQLLQEVEDMLKENLVYVTLRLPYDRGDLAALFHQQGTVVKMSHGEEGTNIEGYLPRRWLEEVRPYLI